MTENEFLHKDYELKIKYLTDHLARMWTRFNFFVTIESALIGGKFLIHSDVPSPKLAFAGIILSGLWYVMGAQDRFLVELYRTEVEKTGEQLARAVLGEEKAKTYRCVGRTDPQYVEAFSKARKQTLGERRRPVQWLEGISTWRSQRFSTTHLAAFIPLAVLVLWLGMFIASMF